VVLPPEALAALAVSVVVMAVLVTLAGWVLLVLSLAGVIDSVEWPQAALVDQLVLVLAVMVACLVV
jgi:hypothetical protein